MGNATSDMFDWRDTTVANCISSSDKYMDARVESVEIRYCHIGSAVGDFFATLGARLTFTTSDACHHWFILVRVEGMDEYVYIDKHWYRNIMKRTNTDGLNGGGDKWNSSAYLRGCDVERNVTLRELIEYVKRDQHKSYHLIKNNCQHFAKDVYAWLRGDELVVDGIEGLAFLLAKSVIS
jgi:hypothetical protein